MDEITSLNIIYHKHRQILKQRLFTYKQANDTKAIKILRQRYPWLDKSTGYRCKIVDIFKTILPNIKENFTTEDIKYIFIQLISKIRGIYKHTQAEKTAICNIRMIQSISLNKLVIAVTKNTLFANEQWTSRLISKIKSLYPSERLDQRIMVISSEKNDLKGNATHCKNISEAYMLISKNFTYQIIFVCSNKRRLTDILELLESYKSISPTLKKPIEIYHDEAHNREDGVPSKRVLVENIILDDDVEVYIPITASNETLVEKNNPLWGMVNLEKNAINYTNFSKIKSTSPNYSSIQDSNFLYLEDIEKQDNYQQYHISEYDIDDFISLDNFNYCGWDINKKQEDINRRRKLEFCRFMKDERRSLNIGMNLLDNIININNGKLFVKDMMSFHLITTPCRCIFTYTLMKHAINQPYNPILIGLYRSSITVMYHSVDGGLKTYQHVPNMDQISQELNMKIEQLLKEIVKQGDTIERPIIIMGNYKPTGESITFVNYKYGTLKSITILPRFQNNTPEDDYQNYSRGNYMDTLFKKNNPSFIQPPKWMIGCQQTINNAVRYEKINDLRINNLQISTQAGHQIQEICFNGISDNKCENIAIPIKLRIHDLDDPTIQEIFTLLNKSWRSTQDKANILRLIIYSSKKRVIEINDKTNKFNDTYKLMDVRSYRKTSSEVLEMKKLTCRRENKKYVPPEDNYRFSSYNTNHEIETPYLNHKDKIKANQCELLCALDNYTDSTGFINWKHTMWLSYKY